MGTRTGIEWTDSTWSPIRARVKMDAPSIAKAKGYTSLVEIAMKMRGHVGQHCEHVSPGCEHCYAGTMQSRCLPANGTGLPYDRRSRDLVEAFVDEKVLLQPLKWKPVMVPVGPGGTIQELAPRTRRIFVENQSDLFAEWVTDEMRDRVCAVGIISGHILQFLTKRAAEMLLYFNDPETGDRIQDQVQELTDDYAFAWPYPNFWLGVSDEGNQHQRIDILRQVPAVVRFVSFEPLLFNPGTVDLSGIGWSIAGCESGPGSRDVDADAFRLLRDQCVAAGVPFFLKQMKVSGKLIHSPLLDGVEYHQFPK